MTLTTLMTLMMTMMTTMTGEFVSKREENVKSAFPAHHSLMNSFRSWYPTYHCCSTISPSTVENHVDAVKRCFSLHITQRSANDIRNVKPMCNNTMVGVIKHQCHECLHV
jgi:hypothetical protein